MAERFLTEDGPTGTTVVSHRDADAKNLLVVDDRPMLIDWETCGPTTVGHELGKRVLDLAGGCRGPGPPRAARPCSRGYAEVAGALPEPSAAWFSEWLMACSSFAAYNVDPGPRSGTRREPGRTTARPRSSPRMLPVLIDTALAGTS